jgi:hypothetical protein
MLNIVVGDQRVYLKICYKVQTVLSDAAYFHNVVNIRRKKNEYLIIFFQPNINVAREGESRGDKKNRNDRTPK